MGRGHVVRTLRQRAEDKERETGKAGWMLRQARKHQDRVRLEACPWLADFALDGDTLTVDGAPVDVRGATARVETRGELRRRVTATRVVATGVFALAAKKKVDGRVVLLTVEGPHVAIVREYQAAKLDQTALAQFVAAVNSLAARSA